MPTTGIGTLLSSWFYLVISTYWTEIFAMVMGILLYKIASYVVVNSTAGLPFVNRFKHRLGRKSDRLPILPPFWPNDPKLLDPSTTHVYIRIDKRQPPLFPAYMGPYQVVKRFSKYFELNMRTHIDRVSIDRLKPAYLSMSILNENLQPSAAEELPFQSPPRVTSPIHLNFQEDIEPQESSSSLMSPQVFTRRGRRVNFPRRFSEYQTSF